MSLTRFLNIPEVRARFRKEFHVPATRLKANILAPPVTRNFSLVGTAFDYLLRFYLERLNPNCMKQTWVAEDAISLIHDMPALFKPIENKADEMLTNAKNAYEGYIKHGRMDDALVRTTVSLAQLDVIFRSGIVDSNFGKANDGDVIDLKRLIEIVPAEQFHAENVCVLNPTFGAGSELVGGADADLLIDDVLLDVKTTKEASFSQEYYNQLIGYYILWKVGGAIGSLKECKISALGIYFSRHAALHKIPTNIIEENVHLGEFIDWFKEKAKQEYSIEDLQ
ncbi:MAG: hypothetical protein ABSE39_10875 [Candidatus Bathyarchaeia archaeon]